ncbi:MAG TPA: DUF2335 domain-containing protein [Candidatus Paceibacterota bacterium]|nr:DUF2335 domain-containing protein [Candidatus Paceibacterota bacterium]
MPNRDRSIVVQENKFHSGPLPAPEDLQRYDSILPGLADRIVRMAENQSEHRQKLENRVVWFDGARMILGLIFGACMALAGIGAGTYLIATGHSAAGLTSMLVPLASIVGAFVYQQKKKMRTE